MEYYPDGTLDNLIEEKRGFVYHLLLRFMMSLMSKVAERVIVSQNHMCGQFSGS